MALSSREKYIAIAVGAVIGLAGLDLLIIDPFEQRGQEIEVKRADIDNKLQKADATFARRRTLLPVWSAMNTVGGLKTDSSEAKSQMIQYLQNWAKESGVTLTSLESKELAQGPVDPKSEKPESKFERIGIHATGYGPMAAMTKLLWKVESAPKLLKVTEIHIAPRVEATDDLQIQLTVATVSLIPDASAAENTIDNVHPMANAAGTGVQP